ncbi:MAG: DEAD/DEAH box helicase [Mucilaginibacter polytrichastri]|nr:DEAD/DEAH box helicase [Mucilaginibacter polytrichastri]
MPKPFSDFDFNKQILSAIAEAGFSETTSIQEKAFPPALNGQDVMGIAQTGTGKTAAYVLPILRRLNYPQDNEMRALILAPTRELAMQIDGQVKLFAKNTGLRSVVVYGGLGPKTQIENIKAGVDILIATPGRFLDIYLAGHIVTKKLQVLVLDEADKMMDMGFMPQINRILEVVPRKRQNLLFSATMGPKVQNLSGNFLDFPIVVEVTPQATPAATVSQLVYKVPNLRTKINLLQYVLEKQGEGKVMIFCKTRTVADNVHHFLERKYGEEELRVIHANKGQNTRINAMDDFKAGHIRLLVATDVAARGLDVSDVEMVINFDVPVVTEDYVHRIGRTGRANKSGSSVTFCNPAEEYVIGKIEKMIRQPIPVEALPESVFVAETSFEERQAMLREIDQQKKRENPEFKGAFHEKKKSNMKGQDARKTGVKKAPLKGKPGAPKKKGKKFK